MSLAKALVAFQKEAPSLHEDATNPHFKNRYLSLEGLMRQVIPSLNKHGLALLQFPTMVDGQPGLRTKLLHEGGEFEEDTMPLVLQKQDPQGQGSGITYARRYAAMAILGLVADEDDDGNTASRSQAQAPAASYSPTPAPSGDGEVAVHFGKNAGKPLSSLTKNQVKWYAETWEPDPARTSPDDLALKAAAVALHAGTVPASSFSGPTFDDSEIPFAPSVC